MSASLPLIVRVFVPLAPALMLALPLKVTLRVPLPTVSWVLARLPSTSVTVIRLPPVMASAVSSATVAVAGTVFTGASLAAATVRLVVATFPE